MMNLLWKFFCLISLANDSTINFTILWWDFVYVEDDSTQLEVEEKKQKTENDWTEKENSQSDNVMH